MAQDEDSVARRNLQAGTGGSGMAMTDQPASARQTRGARPEALEALDELDSLC